MIELTQQPINPDEVTNSVRSVRAGAVVTFLGTVREFTGEAQTARLFYEAYSEMALRSMHKLAEEARSKFPLLEVAIVHRIGELELGDISVAIAVSTPHRGQAFDAARWLIDTLKEQVPIWKREHYTNGRVEWVHPGVEQPSNVANTAPANTAPAAPRLQLIDSFGRVHNNLRISVTDRCNIRCFYCMPADNVEFMPKEELLSFEEITRVAAIATKLGVDRIRLTGGEPLVRRELPTLVAMLHALPGIRDIGLTTNGIFLAEQAQALRDAGLSRLNISLDALDPEVFRKVTRRDGYEKVLEGIEAARKAGFDPIKLNAVSVRGLTEDQIIPFGTLARESNTVVRFIEFMPLDADSQWQRDKVLFAHEIIAKLESEFGELRPVEPDHPNAPAQDFQFADGRGRIGLIASVSRPFCGSCNRFRVTADGKLRNCLFSHEETDIRPMLRGDATDQQIAEQMLQCIAAKKEGHEINTARFIQPDRPMYSIGG